MLLEEAREYSSLVRSVRQILCVLTKLNTTAGINKITYPEREERQGRVVLT